MSLKIKVTLPVQLEHIEETLIVESIGSSATDVSISIDGVVFFTVNINALQGALSACQY